MGNDQRAAKFLALNSQFSLVNLCGCIKDFPLFCQCDWMKNCVCWCESQPAICHFLNLKKWRGAKYKKKRGVCCCSTRSQTVFLLFFIYFLLEILRCASKIVICRWAPLMLLCTNHWQFSRLLSSWQYAIRSLSRLEWWRSTLCQFWQLHNSVRECSSIWWSTHRTIRKILCQKLFFCAVD